MTNIGYNLFSGVFDKEEAEGISFFWTKRRFSLCSPEGFCGILFSCRSLSADTEVTVYRTNGKQSIFYAPQHWVPCAIMFDDHEDILLFSCSRTVSPENDGRELGICIENISFTNDINMLELAIKNNRKLQFGENHALAWPMTIDHISDTARENWPNTHDYTRYRSFELHLQEIRSKQIPGDTAEVGIYLGDTAYIINKFLPDRRLYLYDTFSGFNEYDLEVELANRDVSKKILEEIDYCDASRKYLDPVSYVVNRMPYKKQIVIRKGYFPDTAKNDMDIKFSFVSIDCDLYIPILNSLEFFIPRLSKGGYIFIHDFNSETMFGAKRALKTYEERKKERKKERKI